MKNRLESQYSENRTLPPGRWIIRISSRVSLAPVLIAGIAVCHFGCSPSPRGPEYQPEAMVREAFRLFDADKNGKLTSAELKRCPSLADALVTLDSNGDKAIDEAELRVAFDAFVKQNAALNSAEIRVTRNDKPVVGAKVRLVPEEFMLGLVEPAEGTTNAAGVASPKIAGQSEAGVRLGFYRAEVTRDGESIAAKYNAKTTLGKMIGYRWRGVWHIRLD